MQQPYNRLSVLEILFLTEHAYPAGFWLDKTVNGSAREVHVTENPRAIINSELLKPPRHIEPSLGESLLHA